MGRKSSITSNPAVRTYKFQQTKFEIQKDKNGRPVLDENDQPKKKKISDAGWYCWVKNENAKEGEPKGTSVAAPKDMAWMWLESAQSFTGYCEKAKKSVYSNEILTSPDAVKKYGRKPLRVMVGDEEVAYGFYQDIKETVKGFGGKFCVPVYAATCVDAKNDSWEVIRLLMPSSAWINFFNSKKAQANMIKCLGFKTEIMKTGGSYQAPVFEYALAEESELAKADELYDEVEAYFDYVMTTGVKSANGNDDDDDAEYNTPPTKTKVREVANHQDDSDADDDLPF